jgi:hypothetical protein
MSQTIMLNERYATIAEALAANQGVTRAEGKMHAVSHLRVDNKLFAMLVNENLVVRLPKTRAEALIASGNGLHFDPGFGRIMSGWVSVSPDAEEDWMSLSREALEYVGGKYQPLLS